MDKSDLEHVEADEVNKYELSPAELIAASEQHTARSSVERRLLWKADLAILPIISAAYLVSYLVSALSLIRMTVNMLPGPKQHWQCSGYGSSQRPSHESRPILQLPDSILLACYPSISSSGIF